MKDNSINSNSIIISLDVDALLFNKLEELVKYNFTMIEINSSEPTLLKKAIQDFPRVQIGAGNVINSQQLQDCCNAGVNFVTSPGFLAPLAQTAEMYSVKYIPGIATISEGMQALAFDKHSVKVFPANIELCKYISKTLPLLSLFPAGVSLHQAKEYMQIPGVAAVTIENPDLQELRNLSSDIISATAS